LAVARAAVPQPPSLLNYHPHTDRQAADGETHCVQEEIQFGDETNVLHRGGCGGGAGGGPGSHRVWEQFWLSLAENGRQFVCDGESDPSCIYLFIYLIIYSFIYSVPQIFQSCFWLQIPNWQLSTP